MALFNIKRRSGVRGAVSPVEQIRRGMTVYSPGEGPRNPSKQSVKKAKKTLKVRQSRPQKSLRVRKSK